MKIHKGTGRLRRTEAFAQVPDGSGNVNSVIGFQLQDLADYTSIVGVFDFMKVHKITVHWIPKDPNVTGLIAMSAQKSKFALSSYSTWVAHVEQGDSPLQFGNLNKPFTLRYKNPEPEWVEIYEADEDAEREDYNILLNIRDAPVSTNVGQLLVTIDASFK